MTVSCTTTSMAAVKVIRVLGTSPESWDEAAREAVREADKTVDDIHGVEVEDRTAVVEDGEITEYKSTVSIAFPVHEQR